MDNITPHSATTIEAVDESMAEKQRFVFMSEIDRTVKLSAPQNGQFLVEYL